MIIQGHPDILLGPRGLNGLHGFGSLPPQGASPAYIRFMPEKGGLGIDVLYQEIRDFINTPGRTQAEIEQAMEASGVSDQDVANAFASAPMQPVFPTLPTQPSIYPGNPDEFAVDDFEITPLSAAYIRFLPENGGQGLDVLYKEIRDFLATNPTQAELEQAMQASGVNQADIDNAFAQQPPVMTDAQVRAALELAAQAVNSNPYGYSAAYIRFLPENGGLGIPALYREIMDFLATNPTRAELEQAMRASGVSEDDVINARATQVPDNKIVDNVFPVEVEERATGLAPIPDSSLRNREIVDYVMTHSDAEIRAQMVISNVSQDDIIQAFAAYDPTMPSGRSPAYTRSLPENGGGGIANFYKEINDFVKTHSFYEVLSQMFRSEVSRADLEAANAYALSQAPAGGGSGDVMQPVFEQPPTGLAPVPDSSLRNREIVDYVMTHSDAEIRAQMVISNVTQDDIINAFASFDPTMPNGQSPAYARSLPENGGGGIANFYKEINDFVKTHSFYEVLSQMFRSGVSRKDVENANKYAFSQSAAGGGSGDAAAAAEAARIAAAAAAAAQEAAAAEAARVAARTEYLADIARREAAAARAAAAAAAAEAEKRRIAAVREAERPIVETGRQQAYLEAQAAAAAAAAAQDAAADAAQAEYLADLKRREAAAAAQEAAADAALAEYLADIKRVEAAAAAAAAEPEKRRIAALRAAADAQAAARAAYDAQAAARAAQEVADARARADALAAQAAQAAQQQDAIQAALAAQEAAAAAAAAQKASDKATAAIATAQASASAVLAETATKAVQSEAYNRYLPENGGQGVDVLYQEIRDYVSTHTDAEIKQTAAASGVSNTDIVKAVNQTQQATTVAVVASAAAVKTAATAAAASAATAAAIAVAKSPAQSQAYTRFLPENGGKGITALYKEISDFVAVSSNEEIKTAMAAGGISEADVLNALKVFPKKVITEPAKDTGLVLPLVISAIAAFLVLG